MSAACISAKNSACRREAEDRCYRAAAHRGSRSIAGRPSLLCRPHRVMPDPRLRRPAHVGRAGREVASAAAAGRAPTGKKLSRQKLSRQSNLQVPSAGAGASPMRGPRAVRGRPCTDGPFEHAPLFPGKQFRALRVFDDPVAANAIPRVGEANAQANAQACAKPMPKPMPSERGATQTRAEQGEGGVMPAPHNVKAVQRKRPVRCGAGCCRTAVLPEK